MYNLQTAARRTKAKLTSYQQGEYPNIALIAAIRGGSTLVADMLAAQQGMWFADEPFALRHNECLGEQLQALSKEQIEEDCRFFDLSSLQHDEVHHYMTQLNRAEVNIGTSRNTQFLLRANRACFKILRASWLTDFFAEQQGMQVLFVIRHPAAQALSVMRLKWPYAAEIYFTRLEFLQRYFSDNQIEYGQKILAEGKPLQKAVLSWICDIIYPLRYSQQVSCQLFYEHLVAYPERSIQDLCKVLNLSDSKVMSQILGQPSGSSKLSKDDTNKAILLGDSKHLLKKWCGQLDEMDRNAAQEVLDHFEINCYNMYDIMPKSTK